MFWENAEYVYLCKSTRTYCYRSILHVFEAGRMWGTSGQKLCNINLCGTEPVNVPSFSAWSYCCFMASDWSFLRPDELCRADTQLSVWSHVSMHWMLLGKSESRDISILCTGQYDFHCSFVICLQLLMLGLSVRCILRGFSLGCIEFLQGRMKCRKWKICIHPECLLCHRYLNLSFLTLMSEIWL